MAHALINRPVRMHPKRDDLPWRRNPARHRRILLEQPGMPDYEPRLLLETDEGAENHILLLEHA